MDLKKQEKLVKRLKPLLDDKQKLKSRFKSLQSFLGTNSLILELSTQVENLKYFQENDSVIFAVVSDTLSDRIAKIRGTRDLIQNAIRP
jgi:hypothetical protein